MFYSPTTSPPVKSEALPTRSSHQSCDATPASGCVLSSSCWLPLSPLLRPSPEHHPDPVGPSDCDLYRPDGVFRSVPRRLRFLPGSVLLPKQEENQRPRQNGEIFNQNTQSHALKSNRSDSGSQFSPHLVGVLKGLSWDSA